MKLNSSVRISDGQAGNPHGVKRAASWKLCWPVFTDSGLSAEAAMTWHAIWDAAGYSFATVETRYSELAAVFRKSEMSARRALAAIEAAGLAEVGKFSGGVLRIRLVDPISIGGMGFVPSDPQRTLFEDSLTVDGVVNDTVNGVVQCNGAVNATVHGAVQFNGAVNATVHDTVKNSAAGYEGGETPSHAGARAVRSVRPFVDDDERSLEVFQKADAACYEAAWLRLFGKRGDDGRLQRASRDQPSARMELLRLCVVAVERNAISELLEACETARKEAKKNPLSYVKGTFARKLFGGGQEARDALFAIIDCMRVPEVLLRRERQGGEGPATKPEEPGLSGVAPPATREELDEFRATVLSGAAGIRPPRTMRS